MSEELEAAGQDSPGHRRVDLGDDRELVVRPSTPDDADGLDRLYRALSADDQHRRFFTAFPPSRDFVERWAAVGQHGGYGVVAVVVDRAGDGGGELVAEAGYAPLSTGDCEFAITVAKPWRGWLGPYLLDALVEVASARGVPALLADVLLENRPMLAVAQARGHAVLDSDDYSVVRVVIGTGQRTPDWPGPHDRPRVVVESPSSRWRAGAEARAADFQVVVCAGPDAHTMRTCPAMEGRPCPLASWADAIVVALPPSSPRTQALIDAHRVVHHDVPLVVDLTRGGAGELTLPCDACVLPAGTPASEVIRTLREVLGRPAEDGGGQAAHR